MPQDLDKEDTLPAGYEEAPYEEIHTQYLEERRKKKSKDKDKAKKMHKFGFEAEQG